MQHALEQLQTLKERAGRAGVVGHREFNPGCTRARSEKSAHSFGSDHARCVGAKRKRGAQFREDYPNKEERFAKVNTMISRARGRLDANSVGAASGNARVFETNNRGDGVTENRNS